MHFMNPIPALMPLVELIRGLETSNATVAACARRAEAMGKTVAEARDVPGFLANRMLLPMLNEAVFCLYEGVGDAEAIDTVMRLGMNHPLGPLALADLIGLDTCLAILEVLHDGFGDPKFRPCPLWRQYVEAGRLGRKAGRGFHRTASRGGQLGALATVALWCGSFALIKHLVDSGLAAQDIAMAASSWPGPASRTCSGARAGCRDCAGGDALRILVAAAGGVTAYHLALNAGERTTASGVAALIVALAPAATLALALAVGLESFAPAPHGGHRARVRGRRGRRRAGLGRELLAARVARPAARAVAPLTFALYNFLFKPLLGRFDLPALTAAGGLAGSLLFLPFEDGGAVDRFGGARRGRLDLARRARARCHARRLRHVEHRAARASSPRARCPTSTSCRRWPSRSARWRWASP